MEEFKRINVDLLINNGLLFELNRSVLHPFGFMLTTKIDEDGNHIIGDLLDCRDMETEVTFNEEAFGQGRDQFNVFMSDEGMEKIEKRYKLLGYTIQE